MKKRKKKSFLSTAKMLFQGATGLLFRVFFKEKKSIFLYILSRYLSQKKVNAEIKGGFLRDRDGKEAILYLMMA